MEAFVFSSPVYKSAKLSRCSYQAGCFTHPRKLGLCSDSNSRSYRIRQNYIKEFSRRQNHGNLRMSLLQRPQFLQEWLSKLKTCEPIWLARIGTVLVVMALVLFALKKRLAANRITSNQHSGLGKPGTAAEAKVTSDLLGQPNKLSSLEFSRTEWEQGIDVSLLNVETFAAKQDMKDTQRFSLSRSEWEPLETLEEIASMQPGMRKESPVASSMQQNIDTQSPPLEAPSDISSARWTGNRYSISFQRKTTPLAHTQVENATNQSSTSFASDKTFMRIPQNVQLANELAVNLSPWHLLRSFLGICWSVFTDVLVPLCLISFMAMHDYALRLRSFVDPNQKSIFGQLSLVTLASPLGATSSSSPSSSASTTGSVDTSEKESRGAFDQNVSELNIPELDYVASFVIQTVKSMVSKVVSSFD
mmetsp:Transcript_13260/g.22699  ORF Transcript_13260/g.22699 Transcript_13260/m.22699 type:complete len:418 (+) Transcript_13260:50-1303(+)